jgi:hypothetical protein
MAKVVYLDGRVYTINVKYYNDTTIQFPSSKRIIGYLNPNDQWWHVDGFKGRNIARVVPIRRVSKYWSGDTTISFAMSDRTQFTVMVHEVKAGNFDPLVLVEPPADPKSADTACDPALSKEVQLEKQLAAAERVSFQRQIASAQKQIAQLVDPSQFLSECQQDYQIPRKLRRAPFNVRNICHRGNSTYIWSSSQEQAAFQEIADGKPDPVNFQYQDGVYTIDGIVDAGELTIGKKHGVFRRK